MRYHLSFCFAVVLTCTLLPAATLTVGPSGTYATLQAAVDAAEGLMGDHEIRIQQGVYNNGTTDFTVYNNLSLSISGGWNAAFSVRTEDPSLTVLSGGDSGRVLNGNASGTGRLQLRNLTLTQGFTEQTGAGLSLGTSDSPLIEIFDCNFVENRGGFDDGSSVSPFGVGIEIDLNDESRLYIQRCLFQNNIARGSSGANGAGANISPSQTTTLEISECRFLGNEVHGEINNGTGAGLHLFSRNEATVTIKNNLFEGNITSCIQGSSAGGGAYLGFADNVVADVSGNIFRNNTLRSDGPQAVGGGLNLNAYDKGGVLFEDNLLEENRIEGETGIQDGTGSFLGSTNDSTLSTRRNTWRNNSAGLEEGPVQLYLGNSSSQALLVGDSLIADSDQSGVRGSGELFWLTNVTITNNAQKGIAFLDGDLNNSIVYGNGEDIVSPLLLGGTNNLVGIDPFFNNPATGDYRPMPGSPAVDTGNNAPLGSLGTQDLAGEMRLFGTAVDIGAYELQVLEQFQYLTQIGNGSQAGITLSTEIDVANANTERQVAVTVDFFDSGGGRWGLGVAGQEAAGEVTATSLSALLQPGETWVIDTSGTGEIEAGYARIRSGNGLGVTGIFTRRDTPTGTILYQAGVPASQWLHNATLFVDSTGDLETGLAIVNVSDRQLFPSSTALSAPDTRPAGASGFVSLLLYDESFTLLGETVLELPPGEHEASFISQLFEDVEEAAEMRGILIVVSFDPVALVTLRQNDSPGVEYPGEIPTLAAFPVLEGRPPEPVGPEPSGVLPLSFYFAQIGNGQQGTIALQTSVSLANLASSPAHVVLDFFQSNGEALDLTLSDLGSGSSFDFDLASGESRVLETDGTGPIQAGYLWVTAPEGVEGSAVFSRVDVPSGILETESGVPASTLRSDFLLFVDTIGSAETGLALVNPGPILFGGGPPVVELTLLNMAGQELGTRELELPSGQHTAQFVTQLFDDLEEAAEMRGLLRVSSPVALAAVTLLQNDDPSVFFPEDVGTLTAFPVLDIP